VVRRSVKDQEDCDDAEDELMPSNVGDDGGGGSYIRPLPVETGLFIFVGRAVGVRGASRRLRMACAAKASPKTLQTDERVTRLHGQVTTNPLPFSRLMSNGSI
jgi:hypothetical protein